MTLRVLPPGDTIQTTAGHAYAFDANVKTSHTKADVFDLASSKSLRIATYGEGPEADGYRRVVVIALATAPAELPWSLPAPASWFDSSALVEATEEDNPTAATAAIVAASSPTPQSVPTTTVPALTPSAGHWWRATALGAGLLGAAVAGELLARRMRRI